jgi:hypothetical protein
MVSAAHAPVPRYTAAAAATATTPPPPPLLLLLLLLLLPVWTAGFSHTRSERTINTTFAWNASVLLATAKKLHEKYAPDFGHQSDKLQAPSPAWFLHSWVAFAGV